MSDTSSVQIHIFGKEYNIRCPEEKRAALYEAASHLDRNMRDIADNAQVRSTERIAIMAALNTMNELLTVKHKNNKQIEFIGEKIQSLQNKIEKSLTQPVHLEV